MRLQEIADTILVEAVRAQATDEFDTHDVIFWISSNYPSEYAADLHNAALDDAGDPFDNFHMAIARRLTKFPHLLQQQHQKRRSPNVRGRKSECEIWLRVSISL